MVKTCTNKCIGCPNLREVKLAWSYHVNTCEQGYGHCEKLLVGQKNASAVVVGAMYNDSGDIYVIALRMSDQSYITWYYNQQTGGFGNGHYDMTLFGAVKDLYHRLYPDKHLIEELNKI